MLSFPRTVLSLKQSTEPMQVQRVVDRASVPLDTIWQTTGARIPLIVQHQALSAIFPPVPQLVSGSQQAGFSPPQWLTAIALSTQVGCEVPQLQRLLFPA